ncbi:GNAT family N-acetyltransferase [Caedibacter taeniospiralis]|uniref:GNAT family N-acetyltransferase n=1 Tax=Caedibacter taeniospiralis TaxID=28907 RepID=UPI000C27A24B|nr:GNAT family N-acetyltransferase [Caedibacter taeniospiralis]
MKGVVIRSFEEKDAISVENLLKIIGWADQYVQGQLIGMQKLFRSQTGEVFVAIHEQVVVGFIQAEHHTWNTLTQLQGLVVRPDSRRLGIAKNLVEQVKLSSKNRQQRGIYVDTPVDNVEGRKFYTSVGFTEAYIMPQFYESDLNGVTFQKFFDEEFTSHHGAVLEELKSREPIFHHPEKLGKTKQDIEAQMCDEFWEVGASGNVYTKKDVIDTLLKRYSEREYQDIWEAKDFTLTQIAADNYLLTYVLIQNKTRMTRRSTIWRRVNGAWKILYHQGTVIDGDKE